jgi:hypothetical protein
LQTCRPGEQPSANHYTQCTFLKRSKRYDNRLSIGSAVSWFCLRLRRFEFMGLWDRISLR